MADIKWSRGDTKLLELTITQDGQPMDLSGYDTVTICVDKNQFPTDVTTQLFKQEATILDQVTMKGKVTVDMASHADNLGAYFYDIQGIETTTLRKHTLVPAYEGNKFIFYQDINKD